MPEHAVSRVWGNDRWNTWVNIHEREV
jgi:hypothetical protein